MFSRGRSGRSVPSVDAHPILRAVSTRSVPCSRPTHLGNSAWLLNEKPATRSRARHGPGRRSAANVAHTFPPAPKCATADTNSPDERPARPPAFGCQPADTRGEMKDVLGDLLQGAVARGEAGQFLTPSRPPGGLPTWEDTCGQIGQRALHRPSPESRFQTAIHLGVRVVSEDQLQSRQSTVESGHCWAAPRVQEFSARRLFARRYAWMGELRNQGLQVRALTGVLLLAAQRGWTPA